eukprot:403960-Rhodomonas_salina.1
MEQDLHPWGCYMAAKLPKEHPLVAVDSTHADQGLEGVFLGWHDTTPSAWMYSVQLQLVMLVQDAIFHHDMDYLFLDPSCIVTPGTLTADQINEMHSTDLESGESLEAQAERSEEGGAEHVGTFRDELTEILEELKKPLKEVLEQATRQLRKRVRELETRAGVDLGTDLMDDVPEDTTIRDSEIRKHYSEWTSGAQVPLTADSEIDSLKDQQLGHCLAHHHFVIKLPADWYPPELATKRAGYIMVKQCWNSKGKQYLDCDILEPIKYSGSKMLLPISEPKLSKQKIERGEREHYQWHMRKLLDTVFAKPRTLEG